VTNRLDPALCREARDAFAAHGSKAAAARALGVSITTFRHRLDRGDQILDGPQTSTPDPQTLRAEARDAKYWKRRADSAERHLADAEHMVKEISGVLNSSINPPEWILPAPSETKSRSVVAGMVSDTHVGEVVSPTELDNANGYDLDTYRRRYRRLIVGFIEIGARWIVDCSNVGFLYLRGGDTISGDIHEELRITNELTAHEQVATAVEEESAGIAKLAESFGRVHVASVPGNHARTTFKPTHKLYASTSYDTLISKMLAERFKNDQRVTFQTSESGDVVVPVLGWQLMLTHGDRIGSRGGQGFIGPVGTIVRGLKKVRDQQSGMGRPVDIICHGHFHTTANPGRDLSNGSVIGYNEFVHSMRATPESPQQWMFLIHERWGLRERVPVQLEDPKPIGRPRVRIPAVMSGV
jgi:hypothetical protein